MIQSVADLCVNLAEAIVSSKVNSLAAQYYGRGLCVMVGGYGSDEDGLTEANAPFAWIYPDVDDQNVFADQLNSAKVNICIGLSVVKDLPSMDMMIAKAGSARNAAANTLSVIKANVSVVETEEYTAAAEDAEDAYGELSAAYDDFISAANDGDIETSASKYSALTAKDAAWIAKVNACLDAAEDVQQAYDAIEGAKDGEQVSRLAFVAAYDDVSTKHAAHDDDPYYREVRGTRSDSSGQIVVYGGIRMFEALRKQMVEVIKDGAFGLPVKEVKMSQNSTSHYPLDWTQISVTFGEPESL